MAVDQNHWAGIQTHMGMAKIVASILMVLALPLLIVCLLFVGGAILIVPVAMIGIAAGIMKSCIKA